MGSGRTSKRRVIEEVVEYLKTLRDYRELLRRRDELSDETWPRMEELRQKLLLGRNRMKSLVGDIQYQQFGMLFSAWNALGGDRQSGDQRFGLSSIDDALVAKLGDLEESGAKEWRIYEVTNPLFWVVRLWEWLWSALRWSCARLAFAGLWSRTAKIIYFAAGFVAAIATIASVILKATGTW